MNVYFIVANTPDAPSATINTAITTNNTTTDNPTAATVTVLLLVDRQTPLLQSGNIAERL